MTFTAPALNMEGMSDEAKRAVLAAVDYAYRTKQKHMHEMTFKEFCDLTKLATQPDRRQLIVIMCEMRRATGLSFAVDNNAKKNHSRPNGSWPVFTMVGVSHTHILFEVCSHMWEPQAN